MTSATYNPGKGEGQKVGVAILGLGTVGTQVLRLLNEKAEDFERRIGGPLRSSASLSAISPSRAPVCPQILLPTMPSRWCSAKMST